MTNKGLNTFIGGILSQHTVFQNTSGKTNLQTLINHLIETKEIMCIIVYI